MKVTRCLSVVAASLSVANGYNVQPRSSFPTRTQASVSLRPKTASSSFSFSSSSSSFAPSPTALFVGPDGFQRDEQLTQQTNRVSSSSAPSSSALQMSDTVDAETLQNDKDQRINNIALLNGSVLAFLAFATAYNLMHVQVEALMALWEYDLGPHGPDLTKAAVALDLFARLPIDAIRSYEALVPTNPIFYKACTSGVAYALGDLISQIYQGRTISTLDLPRSFRSGTAGFIGHGPLCHYWLTFMETYLDFDGAWWATGIKVTADLTVWSIFLSASYSFIIGMLQFRDPRDVWKDVQTTTWPALRSAWRFWPFVHTVSFSHAVPMDLKLLWVDVMEVVWVTILSKVANEDKNAKRKADEAVETLDVVESFGVTPAMEVEMTREVELSSSTNKDIELAFELPKKVLAACWPLIAMWPVLWAGYQIEKMLGLEV